MSLVLRGCVAAALLFVTNGALAAPCEADHLAVQKHREAGELKSAREAALRCAEKACPGLVQTDCASWLEEIDADTPSVLLSVEGADVAQVRVSLDGGPLEGALGGLALPLDPGAHVFRFEAPERPAVEVRIVAKVGTKNEPVIARFGGEQPSSGLDTPRIAAVSLMSVGGAALLIFGGLAIAGEVKFQDLEDTCAPSCDSDDVQATRSLFLGADVSLGIGLAALASGVLVYFVVPKKASAANVALRVGPRAGGGFGSLTLDW